MKPAKDAADESALKVPILEAEILGLRQVIAEMKVKRENLRQEMDELRRDRDHWQNVAKSAEAERTGTRAWFCGRALPSK
jgi:FtsZ-binding cell division protein ZapB